MSGWGTPGRLSNSIEPEDVLESHCYETFKKMVEVCCKASGINISALCTVSKGMVTNNI